MPYLFLKHARSKSKLQASVRLFSRSHYFYFGVYAGALLLALVQPVAGAIALGVGLSLVLAAHLAHDFWGLQFTASEIGLTAMCQPVVPLLRSFYWFKGLIRVRSWRREA